ncbi:MAG: hypothetical protein PHN74_02310 [Candidatus Pacebacteria bacterium]|nr:hypothetical protein [Candidatus Paceibacterota bacterium]
MINSKTKLILTAIALMVFVFIGFEVANAAFLDGIVPCGKCCKVSEADPNTHVVRCTVPCSGVPIDQAHPCTLCDLARLLKNLIDFGIEAAMVLAVASIVWGGIVLMTAGGSEKQVEQGKEVLTITMWAVLIVLGSWLIMGTILNILGGSQSMKPWNQIQCTMTGQEVVE